MENDVCGSASGRGNGSDRQRNAHDVPRNSRQIGISNPISSVVRKMPLLSKDNSWDPADHVCGILPTPLQVRVPVPR